MERATPQLLPCPTCGFLNEADDAFCGKCRTALAPQGAAAAPAKPATFPCPACGFANEADDLFCGNCRRPLGDQASAAHPVSATPAAGATPAATQPATAPPAQPAVAAQMSPPPPPPKPVQSTTPVKPGEVACPNCGTPNLEIRLFCIKCATQLRAEALPAKKPPLRLHRGMVLPFVLSAVIGLGATVGGARLGAIVLARAPQPTAVPGTPVVLPGDEGAPVGIALTPAAPKPLDPLPDNSTIRLASYEVPTPSEANDPERKARWWSDTLPRVPAVSQFDGGPLAGVNCVMASGAMLARLAFGIVTTGSQLRALQRDQDGASSYGDLNDAVERGWNVNFLRGLLTPTQLRALSYAGAGLVVSLDYGEVPENVRVQRSFTGNHSVYIDAFTPNGPDGGPAYWVMDPIGHAWAGYKGGWWPAEDIERAGMSRSGGKIYATWAFAGGVVPDRHKVLPPDAFPGATSGPTEAPSEAPPSVDPMPSGDLPIPPDDPDTGTPPPDIPAWIPISINTNVYLVEPKPEGLACTVQPVPAGCPGGIIGVIGPGTAADPTVPPTNQIDILYGTVIAPGTVQIVFDAPSGTTGQLWTWSSTGIPLLQTFAQPATIGGNDVSIATISVDPSGTLSFFATATSPTFSGLSTVGTLVVGG